MRYRPLGRTGQFVSEICLGTMTFHGGTGMWRAIGTVEQSGANALIERALAAGVNFIDTADVYAEGQSEVMLGQALRDLKVPREDVIVATKVRGRTGQGANSVGLSRGHIVDQIAGSLKRLQLDHIDLYQLHGFDPLTPLDETLSTLNDLVRSGKVRYIGLCNMAAWQIMKALAISEKNHWSRFESVQAYYTLAGRDLEREVVPLVEDQGLGIMVWSPLAGGLLSGKFAPDGQGPAGARRATFDFPIVDKPRAFRCIDVMRPIAERHQVSVARVALAWLLSRPQVSTVIVGAKTAGQLGDNLAATDFEFAAEELAALDTVSALPPEFPGWMLARQAQLRAKAPVKP